MEDYGYRPYHYRLWGFAILTVLLTIFLAVKSLNIQRTHDPICRGIAGAGFPLTFVCDTLGESPTSSWGKIDFVDVLNGGLLPGGFLVDFLFYFILIGIIWFTVSSLIFGSLLCICVTPKRA